MLMTAIDLIPMMVLLMVLEMVDSMVMRNVMVYLRVLTTALSSEIYSVAQTGHPRDRHMRR